MENYKQFSLIVLFLFSTILAFSPHQLLAEGDPNPDLSESLFEAYELSDCDREAELYEAYETISKSETIYRPVRAASTTSAAMMMMDVTECQRISSCDGDAEQYTTGGNLQICGDPSLTDLDIGEQAGNANVVGLNFSGWNIPPGATITNADIQFTALSNSVGPAAFNIFGEAADNAAPYSAGADIVTRGFTSANANWTPGTWTAGASGTAQQTTDISAIIQEIIDRPGYAMGNNLGFIIFGRGVRQAYDFENDPNAAPELCITYTLPDEETITCDGCPNISVLSLDGVPGFPIVDLLNVCSTPDTASILIYNQGECMISSVDMMVTFDEGLSYGGFVFMDPNSTGTGAVSVTDLSDPTQPMLTVTEIGPGMAFIINFGLQADCDIDVETEEDINFDAMVTFSYPDANGTDQSCQVGIEEVGAYNAGIRIPVINVRSISPAELAIDGFNTPYCQTVTVSQDGIEAYLENYAMTITNIDLTGVLSLTGISANGTTIPASSYSYDAASMTLTLDIDNSYFAANSPGNGDDNFDESERMTLDFCYELDGCPPEADFFEYNAYYGCNNAICFEMSTMEAAISAEPDFMANPSAVMTSVDQMGALCGNDLVWSTSVSSLNTDAAEGLWKDLLLSWNACQGPNYQITQVLIGGQAVPFTIVNGSVILDFTANTNAVPGLMDQDLDGFIDDLPGGVSLDLEVITEFKCADGGGCLGTACSIEKIDISGIRNCGAPFQDFATLNPAVTYGYGETAFTTNENVDYEGINLVEIVEFDDACTNWEASQNGVELTYDFGANNVSGCGGSNIYMNVTISGGPVQRIRPMASSATYMSGGASISNIVYGPDPADPDFLTFTIDAGDSANDGGTHSYYFNYEVQDTCSPPDFFDIGMQVIEECSGCDEADPCLVYRSCHNVTTRVVYNGAECECTCPARGFVEIERCNFGYTDKTMTTKVDPSTLPEEELIRFIPGDTALVRWKFIIDDIDEIMVDGSGIWKFIFREYGASAPGILDVANAYFEGWYVADGTTGNTTQIIDIPGALPASQKGSIWGGGVQMWNLGADLNYGGNINCDWSLAADLCENKTINPDYHPTTSPYQYLWVDANTGHSDAGSVSIYWERPEGCGEGSDCDAIISDADENAIQTNNTFLEDFVAEYGLDNGDTLYFDVKYPVMHNPGYELSILNGTTIESTNTLVASWEMFTTNPVTCELQFNDRSCNDGAVYEARLPTMNIDADITVDDCDVEVTYTFSSGGLVPALPDGEPEWSPTEYRPAMFAEYIQPNFPQNLVYLGGAYITDGLGTQIPLQDSYIDDDYGNLTCLPDPAGGQCCVAADSSNLAGLRWVDDDYYRSFDIPVSRTALKPHPSVPTDFFTCTFGEPLVHQANDPFPALSVGGSNDCQWQLTYNLQALCPEELLSNMFTLDAQFSEKYAGNMTFPTATLYESLNSCGSIEQYIWLDNPYGAYQCGDLTTSWAIDCGVTEIGCDGWAALVHPAGTEANNPHKDTYNAMPTSPDNFDPGTSTGFPPLLTDISNLLLADDPDGNESTVFELCAGTSASATHENVVASIEIPNSIQLINIVSSVGASFTLVQTLANSKVYAIEMADLAPGQCDEIEIITELLFCPVGLDVDTEICINATSGCIDPLKAAVLLAEGMSNCSEVEMCYQYVAEEADLQTEFDPQPVGPYGLCETIPMGIRIKNVKPAVLTNVELDFWLPAGLNYVPGSWQACYPGGPTNTGACVTIPDPTADPSQNNAFGTYFGYDEDADFSSFIDQNGLPGITADQDSNRIQILFEVETICDIFVSGTSVYHQASGADPCGGEVLSMFVESDPIIILNANPVDFAQFFVFAEPAVANCGEDATLTLTYLNISPIGESKESMVCMDIETSTFMYMSGSVQWLAPASHSPAFSETMNGALTTICFDIPDGIGPGEAFRVSFDYMIPDNIDCGTQDLGVQVSTEIMDQSCVDEGELCSVNVLNSVNPTVEISFLPPLNVADQQLLTKCPNADGTVDLCYDIELANPGDFYNNDVVVSLIRDVDQNGIYDELIDTEITNMSHSVVLVSGDSTIVTSCFTVDNELACPVFLQINQESDCVCDNLVYYYDSIEPAINDDMQTTYTLCPGTPLGIELCGSWEYDVSPANGATLVPSANSDSLYITLNGSNGVNTPVILEIRSQTGQCQEFEFPIELYSLADFELGPFAAVQACEVGCQQLSLNIPADFEDDVTVLWSPSTYLDDPTSLTPTICDPASDIGYTVQVEFMTDLGTCSYEAVFPVLVQEQPIEDVIEDGNVCDTDMSTFTAPAGYTTYTWTQVNSDGTESVLQASSSDTFTAPAEGSYYVTYSNPSDACSTRSNVFKVTSCLLLEKSLSTIVPTGNVNEYTVTYVVTVENPSGVPSEYDLYDEPGFDTDIVASNATYTSDAGPSGTLALPAPAAPGWQLGNNVIIPGGTTHTYTIVYLVTIDLEDGTVGDDSYTSCGQGSGPANAGPGEGLFNNASLDLDEDPSSPEVEDDACGELPYLLLDKVHTSTVETSLNCYDVTYTVTVQNIGGADGTYDLVDDPIFDTDFAITSAIYATDALGNPGGSLPITSSTYALANDQTIAPSKTDTYTITVGVCLDLEEDSTDPGNNVYDASCGTANDPTDPTDGEGLYNEATLDVNNDGTPDQEAEACDDVPYLTLVKEQISATAVGDGTHDIVYSVCVENIGGAAGEYDVFDLPQFDNDITINSASFSSDVPSSGALPAAVPATPGWVLATDQAIAVAAKHCYTVAVNVSYDFFDDAPQVGDNSYTECGEGGNTEPGAAGEGLFNEALLDANNNGTIDIIDETCEDLELFDLALTKVETSGGPYTWGDPVTFQIEVFNQAPMTVTDIEITDYIPCGFTYLASNNGVWSYDTTTGNATTELAGPLVAGQTATVSITLELTQCATPADAWTNYAEISDFEDEDGNPATDEDSTPDDTNDDPGGNPDGNSDDVVDGDGSGATGDDDPATDEDDNDPEFVEIFDLALIKTLADPGPYGYQEDITFDITVTNQGNEFADNIVITDYIPSCMTINDANWTAGAGNTATRTLEVGDELAVGGLAPGASIPVTVTVTVGYCVGEIQTNYAEITSATDEEGNPEDDVDSTPDGTNGNDGGGNPGGDSDDTVDGDGTGGNGDDDPTTDEDDHDPEQVQVQVYADLALIKTLGMTQVNPVMVGDAVQFQIEVLNQGPIPTDNIVVSDYLPACLTLVDPDWTNNGDGSASYTLSVASGTLTGPLNPGDTKVITIDFIVASCANGIIENWAEIEDFTTDDGSPIEDIDSTPDDDLNNDTYTTNNDPMGDGKNGGDEDDHDPEQIVVITDEDEVFDLALIKTLAPGQPATVGVGDVVAYQIEVVNQGTYSVDNINVVDYIPSCMSLADPAWSAGPGAGDANITLSVANGGLPSALAPGQSAFVTINLLVNTCSGPTTNFAEITGATDDDGNVWTDVDSTPDSNENNDTFSSDNDTSGNGKNGGDEDDHDPAIVNVTPITPGEFDLALVKQLAAGQPNPVANGDLITFDITVINQGDIPADNIDVVDYLPACLDLADTDWTSTGPNTASITLSVANGGLVTPLQPGTATMVPITVQANGCAVGTETNWAEIEDATDSNGDPVDDIDSTPDDTNDDPYGFDDQTDGDGEDDEDDHDPEDIDIVDQVDEEFDLALIKILSPGQTQAVVQGDLMSFDIQVTNQGNVLADNIQVIDYFPSCLELMDTNWTDNGNNTASITLNVGDELTSPLAPNQSVIVSIVFEVLECEETMQTNWGEISGATDGNGDPVDDVDSTPDTTNDDPYDGSDNETDGDGSPNGDEDDHDPEVFLIMPEEPIFDLALLKTLTLGQPNPVQIGDPVSFDIQVTNQGTEPVHTIEVTDYMPDCMSLTDADWTDNGDNTATILLSVGNGLVVPLVPGQSVVTNITFTVDACAVGLQTNWAEISDFTDEDGNHPPDQDSTPDDNEDNDNFLGDDEILEDGTNGGDEDDHDPADVTVIDPTNMVWDLALTKTLSQGQASSVGPGATVTFDINVTNQGNADADNIEVTDYIPACAMLADANWSAGAGNTATIVLDAGDEMMTPLQPGATFTMPITIVLVNCTGGSEINYAEISDFTDSDGNPQDDTDSTPDDTNGNDGGGVPGGDSDNETDGDGDGTPGDDDEDGDEDDHDPEVINVDPNVPMDFDLALVKKLSAGQSVPVQNGDLVSFEITVYNQGDIAANNIDIVDYIPGCMSLSDSDWVNNGNGTATYTLSTASGTLATPLLPGNNMMVEITLSVDNCNDGVETNWGEISDATDGAGNPVDDVDSTPDDTNDDPYMIDNDTSGDGTTDEDDHDPADVPIGTPDNSGDFDLALVKVLAPGQGSVVMTGEIVDYEIYVINQGDVNADNISVVDYIPSCFTLADPDWTDNGGGTASITISVANGFLSGPLLPGESVPIAISLQVGTCPAGGQQTNFAEITDATDDDGNPVDDVDSDPDDNPDNDPYGEDDQTDGDGDDDEDDHDPETVTVNDDLDPVFDLALTKTLPLGASSTVPVNSVVTFEINVYNQGNVDADNIEVIDYLPSCASLADPAWTDNGDGTASIILSVANGGLTTALTGGQSVSVPITVDFDGCPPGPIVNYAEITDATDEDGEPVDDVDSDPNDNPNDDGTPSDDEINDPNDEDDHDPEEIIISPIQDPEFDLALIKTLAPGQTSNVSDGDIVVFNITVFNQGNVAADNIRVIDYLPACLDLVPDANWFYDASTNTAVRFVSVSNGDMTAPLAPGQSITVPITTQLNGCPEGPIVNYAEIEEATDGSGDPTDDIDSTPDDSNDNDTYTNDNDTSGDGKNGGDEDDSDPEVLEVVPDVTPEEFDLALIKIIAPGQQNNVSEGDLLTFEIQVTNQGNVTADNISVIDYIPACTSLADNDWTNNGDGTASYTASVANGDFLAPLTTGQSVIIPITLLIGDCVAGEQINWAEISGATDGAGDPVDDIDSTPDTTNDDPYDTDNETDDDGTNDEDDHDPAVFNIIPEFDLALTKTVTSSGPYAYGDNVSFANTVYNQGNVPATNIELADYIPAGYIFNAADNPGWTQNPDGTIRYTITSLLGVDDFIVVPLVLEIVRTDGDNSDWDNYTEIADATDEDGNPQEDIDSQMDDFPDNDNDVEPGDDDDNEIDEDSMNGGDEDDHDPAGIDIFDLALVKTTDDEGPFRYGDQVTFDITVYNQGNIPASNVDIMEHIPCGYIFDAAANSAWAYNSTTSIATTSFNGIINPGSTGEVSLTLTVQHCDDVNVAWNNVAEITGATDDDGNPQEDIDSDPDSNPDNDDTIDNENDDPNDEDDHDPEEIEVYDLALRKLSTYNGIDSIGPFVPGDIIDFHIDVFNQGNVDAYDVDIADYLRTGFLYDPALNPGWTQVASDLLNYNIAGPLVAGDSIQLVLKLEVQVLPGAQLGDWYNEAEVTNGDNADGEPQTDADSTPDNDPDNDNDLVDGPDDDPVFNGDENDNVIDEHVDDPFGEGHDDEDDNDAAEILTTGEIGDFVFKDLDGDGIQDPGEYGLQGVVVYLYDCDNNLIATDTTDSDGFYLFDLLLEGDYQLQFDISQQPEGCDFTFQDQGGDDELDSDVDRSGTSECFHLDPAERDSTRDVGLLFLAKIGDFVFEDCDGDGIQDPGEPGIEGIIVKLFDENGVFMDSDTTDASGKYLIDNIYPGNYYLEFITRDGYEFTFHGQGSFTNLDSDVNGSNGFGTTPITYLAPGECDLDGGDAGLYQCVRIGELVWYDTNENDVWDDVENGINGLEVRLYRFYNGDWVLWDTEYTGHKPGTPSDDGYFKFCAPPGQYYLEYNLPPQGLVPTRSNVGFDELRDSDVNNANGPNTTSSFIIRCGEERCDLGAGYYPMASVGDHVWMDDNADGMRQSGEAPAAGVVVEAYNIYNDMVGSAVTDANGEYEIDYLQKDGYYLKFYPPAGYGLTTAHMGSDDNMDSDVDHSNGTNTTNFYDMTPGDHTANVDAGFVFGVLPVELVSFSGSAEGEYNQLDWLTSLEVNADYFGVERSIDGTDDFEQIAELKATGSSSEGADYELKDYDIAKAGVYYYRLRIVDLDGTFEYSDILSLDVTSLADFAQDIRIYPNPTRNEVIFELSLEQATTVQVVLLDATGKVVRDNVVSGLKDAGKLSERVTLDELPSGMYNFRIILDDQVIVRKLMVMKN